MNRIIFAIIVVGLLVSGYLFVKPKLQSNALEDSPTQPSLSVVKPTTDETKVGVSNNNPVSGNDLDSDLKALDQEINVGSKDTISEKDLEL